MVNYVESSRTKTCENIKENFTFSFFPSAKESSLYLRFLCRDVISRTYKLMDYNRVGIDFRGQVYRIV